MSVTSTAIFHPRREIEYECVVYTPVKKYGVHVLVCLWGFVCIVSRLSFFLPSFLPLRKLVCCTQVFPCTCVYTHVIGMSLSEPHLGPYSDCTVMMYNKYMYIIIGPSFCISLCLYFNEISKFYVHMLTMCQYTCTCASSLLWFSPACVFYAVSQSLL